MYYDQLASGLRFQMFAYLSIALGINSTGFYYYLLGYLIQYPVYSCTWNGTPPADPESVCTAENICAGDPAIDNWEIDYSSPNSLHNW